MLLLAKLVLLTILLITLHFHVVVSKRKIPLMCDTHKNCSDLDFENCKNECSNETEKRVVCYFTNWAWYRKEDGKFLPKNIDISLCTHIIYAFALLDNETFTIKSSDPWADIDNNFYKVLTSLKLPVLLSCGGWTGSSSSAHWGQMMKTRTTRKIFIDSVIKIILRYNFSGFDVDYEYPGCPQGNYSLGTIDDARNFNKLIRELKEKLHKHHRILTVTIPAGESILRKCYCISELCGIPDWINVMAYDYHSYADGFVGANAPICGSETNWGVLESLYFLICEAHCSACDLVLGIPLYGKSYTLTDECNHQFGAEVSGPGVAGNITGEAGMLAYNEICWNQKHGWNTGWSESNGSYAWSNCGNQMVSYDDTIDIKRKCCLINKYGMGGAMIWALDLDDFTGKCGCGDYPLLRTINDELRCLHCSSIDD